MNKKTLIIIVTVLVILSAFFLIFGNTKNTLNKKDRNFAVWDTASVTKIFIADKDGNTVLLQRSDSLGWTVNDYPAQVNQVRNLLRTFMYQTVRTPVALAARDNVIKVLAAIGKKVEIYQNVYLIDFWRIKLFKREKLTKTFYVGENTQDNVGTYMMIENSDNPYVVYIPGFKGFVHARYSSDYMEWRDQVVFNHHMQQIESVSLIFPQDQDQSYRIENPDNKNFKIFSFANNEYLNDFDTIRLISYMSGFYDARFEYFVNDVNLFDSLRSIVPFQELTLNPRNGKPISVSLYLKRNDLTEEEMEAKYFEINDYPWDRERIWAIVNDGQELVSIQYYVFGRILRPIEFFKKGYVESPVKGINIFEL